MAVSYQTNWDTNQYLDYPTTPSFSLPDLMDMELHQTLSLDNYNFPTMDMVFDTNIDYYNNQCSYPFQTLQESKPNNICDDFIDFSTSVEKLPCRSDVLVDFSTNVDNLPCLTNDHIGFSTNIRKLSCMSDGIVDFSTNAEKRPRLSNGHVDFSTNIDKLSCMSNDFVDYSTSIEKLPCMADGFVDFSTTVDTLPGFQCPPVFNIGIGSGTGGTLSAQSVAARQRRRKITERTHELGKLVPGGNKMNTAEMFGAAYDYIKYLQAQVGILQLLESSQKKEGEQLEQTEDLEKLTSYSKVQEKLYSQKKCLVPKQLVESLANDHELRNSNPIIAKEIQQLNQTSG